MIELFVLLLVSALAFAVSLRRWERKLDRVLRAVARLTVKEGYVMADLTILTAQVAANTEVEASAIVLIQGLADQLAAAATDPVAITALADQLKLSAQTLAGVIVANTPAGPPPPPPPA